MLSCAMAFEDKHTVDRESLRYDSLPSLSVFLPLRLLSVYLSFGLILQYVMFFCTSQQLDKQTDKTYKILCETFAFAFYHWSILLENSIQAFGVYLCIFLGFVVFH